MSLVSNFIGNISNIATGGIQGTQGFDLSDTTFAELLQKQINAEKEISTQNLTLNLGAPAGFDIQGVNEGVNEGVVVNDISIDNIQANTDNNITTSETVTFFSSLLDNKENPDSEIFDFAKKQAANLYNKYSRSVVTDISEFVEDIKRIN